METSYRQSRSGAAPVAVAAMPATTAPAASEPPIVPLSDSYQCGVRGARAKTHQRYLPFYSTIEDKVSQMLRQNGDLCQEVPQTISDNVDGDRPE